MKTILPESISTIYEAKKLLRELYFNNEYFHPEDDANECLDNISKSDGDLLNKLMGNIYSLEGNENYKNMAFDPCEYLLNLHNTIHSDN